jgi:hypothetical protein
MRSYFLKMEFKYIQKFLELEKCFNLFGHITSQELCKYVSFQRINEHSIDYHIFYLNNLSNKLLMHWLAQNQRKILNTYYYCKRCRIKVRGTIYINLRIIKFFVKVT